MEVDEGGDVFAAELEDELDDDYENEQLDNPGRADECRGDAPVEGGGEGMGDDDDEHQDKPQHAC